MQLVLIRRRNPGCSKDKDGTDHKGRSGTKSRHSWKAAAPFLASRSLSGAARLGCSSPWRQCTVRQAVTVQVGNKTCLSPGKYPFQAAGRRDDAGTAILSEALHKNRAARKHRNNITEAQALGGSSQNNPTAACASTWSAAGTERMMPGSSTSVTSETPPIQCTMAMTCNARAIVRSFMLQPITRIGPVHTHHPY